MKYAVTGVVAAGVGYGLYRWYRWATTESQKLVEGKKSANYAAERWERTQREREQWGKEQAAGSP